MLLNRGEKIPFVQVKKRMLKVKHLIKNTPSNLHHIHERGGVLRTPSNI